MLFAPFRALFKGERGNYSPKYIGWVRKSKMASINRKFISACTQKLIENQMENILRIAKYNGTGWNVAQDLSAGVMQYTRVSSWISERWRPMLAQWSWGTLTGVITRMGDHQGRLGAVSQIRSMMWAWICDRSYSGFLHDTDERVSTNNTVYNAIELFIRWSNLFVVQVSILAYPPIWDRCTSGLTSAILDFQPTLSLDMNNVILAIEFPVLNNI